MNTEKSITLIKLIHQFTNNVVICDKKISIDNVTFDIIDFLKNHFTMDRILFNGKVMSIEEFINF